MFSAFKTKLSAYIEKLLALATPVGTCVFIMGSEIPEGFLAVNGQKVYQSVHSRLYALLAPLTHLTKGTDETGAYVQLPNLDGRVLQGTSDISKVGQLLEASLPNITGEIGVDYACFYGLNGAFSNAGNNIANANGSVIGSTPRFAAFKASNSSSLYYGSSLQPTAVYSLICIRY